MSVAALSTAGFTQYIAASSNVSDSQQAFQSIQQSLDSGNLTAAQSAFNTYSQLNQATSAASTGSSSSTSSTSQLSMDLATLGTAIGSGDLSTAQSAFAALESDLKNTPSQAVTNAEGAVAQTVQWVDDLLSLSSSNSVSAGPVDPTTAILNSAYGQNSSSSSSTDPITSILDSAYGSGAAGSSSATSSTGISAAETGNGGNSASVNAYA